MFFKWPIIYYVEISDQNSDNSAIEDYFLSAKHSTNMRFFCIRHESLIKSSVVLNEKWQVESLCNLQ